MKFSFRFIPICIFALSTLFFACEPVDLTADYKDITITYSVLNQQDSVHYFKVYKGFITDENAFVEASSWDNVYYPVDSIEVRLEEYMNKHLVRSAILDTTTRVERSEGFFPSPKQLLYYSTWRLNEEATYRLVVKRLNTGEEVYAETLVVGNFDVRRPQSSWSMNSDAFTIKFYAAENAALYDIYFTFYYIEVDNRTGAIEHKSLTKKLNAESIRSTSSSEISFSMFRPKDFYEFLTQQIQPNSNLTRYIDAPNGHPYQCFKLQVWAADKNFRTYQEVAAPSSSIVETRLEYTNFISANNDAYGLLASRNFCDRFLTIENTTSHSEDTLVKGSKTRSLGFDYYRNSPLFNSVR